MRSGKDYLLIVGLSIIFMLILLSYGFDNEYISALEEPRRLAIIDKCKAEFDLIVPLFGAVEEKHNERGKSKSFLIGSIYLTESSYDEIFYHYDQQLLKNGWQHFYRDDHVQTLYGYHGGKIDKYAKGDITATIQFSGDRAGYGWDYSFSIRWSDW